MDPIVKVEGLRKTYGATVAVDEVSFNVREGEIFGMVGPNGAGKTTTIECLEGLRKPNLGQVTVLGVDPQHESHFLHIHTGMQLQQSNLPDRMKVWEALDLYSSFYPKAINWEELLVHLGLEEKRNTQFAKLSGGQKQRLFIALALLPDPQLIFLDELTTGLDPQARHAIWDLVRDVRSKGKTILLTTHYMEEAEQLCDRVAILDHGRIVAMDTPAELIRSLGGEERLIFTVERVLSPEFEKAINQIGRLEIQGEKMVVHGNTSQDSLVSDVVSLLAKLSIKFHDLRSEQSTLEDVFLKLTGREMKD
ncbi:MAG: ABC transporter ATP-binding protein [Anaerolineales bacterium]|jgi:ABC-2 type transport system ATP-binding protein